jgi:hypothetical protein
MTDFNISLKVNGNMVEITGFSQAFVTRTVAGAVSSLKDVPEITTLELTLKFGKVKIAINGSPLSLKPFPTLILARTLAGMVSTLKGVEGDVSSLEIKMQSNSPT